MSFWILGIILFALLVYLAFRLGEAFGSLKEARKQEMLIPKIRQEAIKRSRLVLSGNFSEQLAPYLPNFPYSPTECKFLGKPIDMIVFRGLDKKEISEIIFLEIKSGKSKLSKNEKGLKKAIEEKRLRFEEYRVPDELTRKP